MRLKHVKINAIHCTDCTDCLYIMENVQSMYCTKHATDCDMEAMSGQFIDCADDWQIVCPSSEYAITRVVKPDGNLLCCILWKAIPQIQLHPMHIQMYCEKMHLAQAMKYI